MGGGSAAPGGEIREEMQVNCVGEFGEVASSEKKEILGMVSLKAPTVEIDESDRRAPIDVICVIDRSGSMAGSKLNLTKSALSFVIDQLDHRDSLGIVCYDTNVITPLDLLLMTPENKKIAKDAVKGINAGSMTNLSGGLLAGLSMAAAGRTGNGSSSGESSEAKSISQVDVCSVLLFTDGLANVGITAVDKITAATESKLKSCRAGTTVFTFGFGADTDANMLRSIASAGRGMYYFIETVDQIPLSFADCIGGLQSIVAQNIRLKIRTLNGSIITKILSSGFKSTGNCPGTEFTFQLGDLYSEEERDLLFRIEVPVLPEQNLAFEFCQANFEYFNVLTTQDEQKEATGILVRPLQETKVQERNREVDKQFNRITAAEAMEKGRLFADSGDFQSAKIVLEAAKKQFESSPTFDDSFTFNLRQEMEDMSLMTENDRVYKESGRNKMMSKAQSHAVQRSAAPSQESGMYENKSKAKKKAMFH